MISFNDLPGYVEAALTGDLDTFAETFDGPDNAEVLNELRRLTCNRFWQMVVAEEERRGDL